MKVKQYVLTIKRIIKEAARKYTLCENARAFPFDVQHAPLIYVII